MQAGHASFASGVVVCCYQALLTGGRFINALPIMEQLCKLSQKLGQGCFGVLQGHKEDQCLFGKT